ncbi:MAG: hypothetical protein E6J41_05780 [Chloroflexi bacterium]|nr:MAG: hypothetical protein E6J41_05780 [Chloroflexota bacterium]
MDYVSLPGRRAPLDVRVEALAAAAGLRVRCRSGLVARGRALRPAPGEALVANLAWGQERPGLVGTWGWHALRPATYQTGGHSVLLVAVEGREWLVLDSNHEGLQRWSRQRRRRRGHRLDLRRRPAAGGEQLRRLRPGLGQAAPGHLHAGGRAALGLRALRRGLGLGHLVAGPGGQLLPQLLCGAQPLLRQGGRPGRLLVHRRRELAQRLLLARRALPEHRPRPRGQQQELVAPALGQAAQERLRLRALQQHQVLQAVTPLAPQRHGRPDRRAGAGDRQVAGRRLDRRGADAQRADRRQRLVPGRAQRPAQPVAQPLPLPRPRRPRSLQRQAGGVDRARPGRLRRLELAPRRLDRVGARPLRLVGRHQRLGDRGRPPVEPPGDVQQVVRLLHARPGRAPAELDQQRPVAAVQEGVLVLDPLALVRLGPAPPEQPGRPGRHAAERVLDPQQPAPHGDGPADQVARLAAGAPLAGAVHEDGGRPGVAVLGQEGQRRGQVARADAAQLDGRPPLLAVPLPQPVRGAGGHPTPAVPPPAPVRGGTRLLPKIGIGIRSRLVAAGACVGPEETAEAPHGGSPPGYDGLEARGTRCRRGCCASF